MVKTFPFHYLTYDRNGQVYATARKICKQAVGSHRSLLVTQVGLPLISVPPRHCLEAKSTHSLECSLSSFMWSELRYGGLLEQGLSTQRPWAVALRGWVPRQWISAWVTSFTHTSIQRGCWMLSAYKVRYSSQPCPVQWMIILMMSYL